MTRFVDTNILLYAVSSASEDASKRMLANELLVAGNLALSVQVCQEFYAQSTRTGRAGALTHQEAVAFIDFLLSRFPVQPVTVELMRTAFAIRARFGLNYWDCAILAAARRQGCDAVYSEDLSDTQDYDSLRVINPFAPLPQRP